MYPLPASPAKDAGGRLFREQFGDHDHGSYWEQRVLVLTRSVAVSGSSAGIMVIAIPIKCLPRPFRPHHLLSAPEAAKVPANTPSSTLVTPPVFLVGAPSGP